DLAAENAAVAPATIPLPKSSMRARPECVVYPRPAKGPRLAGLNGKNPRSQFIELLTQPTIVFQMDFMPSHRPCRIALPAFHSHRPAFEKNPVIPLYRPRRMSSTAGTRPMKMPIRT